MSKRRVYNCIDNPTDSEGLSRTTSPIICKGERGRSKDGSVLSSGVRPCCGKGGGITPHDDADDGEVAIGDARQLGVMA